MKIYKKSDNFRFSCMKSHATMSLTVFHLATPLGGACPLPDNVFVYRLRCVTPLSSWRIGTQPPLLNSKAGCNTGPYLLFIRATT